MKAIVDCVNAARAAEINVISLRHADNALTFQLRHCIMHETVYAFTLQISYGSASCDIARAFIDHCKWELLFSLLYSQFSECY